MGLTLVTPATSSPVSLEEAKAWCRVDGTADDVALEGMLAAAAQLVEEHLGKSLCAQTWRLALDGFAAEIELPRGPVTAVTVFTYVDVDGVVRTVDPATYALDLVSDPQRVVLADGESWPGTATRVNAVLIEFSAGYATVPAPIATAIAMLVASWFENRSGGDISPGAAALLSPFRRILI